MKLLTKFKRNVKLFFYGLFSGLISADKMISTQTTSLDSLNTIQQNLNNGGVFSDMLETKLTQQVKETVDAHYRIYREADKYDTSSIRIISEDENGVVFSPVTKLKKKTVSDFMKHPPVYNPENAKIRTIQDNKHMEDKYQTNPNILFGYDTTLTVERGDFTPRFKLEKLVKKIVVRECEDNKSLVDLYVPSESTQFGKIDAIVISFLHKYMEEKNYNNDLVDFISFEWVSDKGWNVEDLLLFKYIVKKLYSIDKFDGSFVLTYVCEIIEDGKDLTEKYRTKELDEKYANESPKNNAVDIFAYERKIKRDNAKKNEIDIENLGTSTIKIN